MLQRRRRLPPRAAYGRRFGVALFTGLSGVLAFSLLTDGGRQTRAVTSLLPPADQVLAWTGLRIEQVALRGQRFTSAADVFDAVSAAGGDSLVGFDAADARARIERLPWVSTASISRVYPATLEVRISERRPMAVWHSQGRDFLVDRSGRVLSPLGKTALVRLPRLAGAGAPEAASELMDLIVRYPRVAERFEMAERMGNRRWTLHLKPGLIVHLAADREAFAFAALSSPDGLGKLLAAKDTVIDLRNPGRIAVRRAPADPPLTTASTPQS